MGLHMHLPALGIIETAAVAFVAVVAPVLLISYDDRVCHLHFPSSSSSLLQWTWCTISLSIIASTLAERDPHEDFLSCN
jgi:hypothetical protein